MADIQQRSEEREEAQQQRQKEEARREEARAEESHSQEGQPEKGPGPTKVTLKQRVLDKRRDHHSHVTRRGTLLMYISLILTCEVPRGVVRQD